MSATFLSDILLLINKNSATTNGALILWEILLSNWRCVYSDRLLIKVRRVTGIYCPEKRAMEGNRKKKTATSFSFVLVFIFYLNSVLTCISFPRVGGVSEQTRWRRVATWRDRENKKLKEKRESLFRKSLKQVWLCNIRRFNESKPA